MVADNEGIRSAAGLSRRGELISEPLHGEDQLRTLRISFQLLPHAGDVHIHGASEGLLAVSPNFFQQFISREGCSRVLDEVPQQLELAGGEIDRLAVAGNLRAAQIN